MPTVDDYLALIPSYHRGNPRFVATVRVFAEAAVAVQGSIAAIPAEFDLDTAIGAQEDVIGQWVGRSRYIATPIPNAWFSWDTDGLGWEQGVWQGPYDSTTGLTRLDDETYRLLLRAKIAANKWDGTIEGAAAALAYVFDGTTSIVYVEDHQDMSMVIGIAGTVPSALILCIFSGGYIPLKPAAVRVDYKVTSVSGAPVFGWGAAAADGKPLAGWGTGAWAVSPEYAITHDLTA